MQVTDAEALNQDRDSTDGEEGWTDKGAQKNYGTCDLGD